MRAERPLVLATLAIVLAEPALAQSPRRDSARVASPGDSVRHQARSRADSLASGLRQRLTTFDDLRIELFTRVEAKAQQTRNERCATSVLFRAGYSCRTPFTPALDAQFSLKSAGGFTDRTQVDVDYDSQREFDGSNTIALSYRGRERDILQRVEVGNVTFTPPPSRFITAGIPSGNFGVQAGARFGAVSLTAIAAQQKGNVVRDQVFTVGGTTTRTEQREIEDYQVEPRRFFFTIDPQRLGSTYPNIDILDAQGMNGLALSLADTVRPARMFIYRLNLGGQPPNPNGPRFQLLGDPLSRRGQVYELLREGVDYYLDPSLLWFALVRPLALNNERLVVAYSFRVAGRDTVIQRLGGTPDLEFAPGREQFAHLVWDPQVAPSHPAFRREIRSVYRLGGDDARRETVQLRIVAGTSAEQEKPPGGFASTYLQLFGLSQLNNPATFDAENRLWPRAHDPNFLVAAAPGLRIFRDQFVIFPSLEPFARRGLARPPEVAANDTIYRTPNEYLNSSQHPQSFYRLVARYDVSGGSAGTIALNSVQVRPGSERLSLEGRPLVRDVDYQIDYELGRITLMQPDTLARVARRVVVRYEENPLFATVPTSILGLSSQWTFGAGQLAFTAISQSQRTTFTRPTLGFEPQAALVAGLAGQMGWALPRLARWLARGDTSASRRAPPARLDLAAEVAVSQPRQRRGQQAYLESFSDGGINVNLLDAQWQFSSAPAVGRTLGARFGARTLDTTRATTLAFQNAGTARDGRLVQFTIQDIDPQASLAGTGIAPIETMMWLSLYPLSIGGKYDASRDRYQWRTGVQLPGRRWRSIRTTFGIAGSGVDFSRGEQLEFWTLIDMRTGRRGWNPTLVFDFGDVSENSVGLSPDSAIVTGNDTLFVGRHLEGFNRLDSERDPFSRAFNADVNDLGLAGDVVDQLRIVTPYGDAYPSRFAMCALSRGRSRVLGDNQGNCSARNGRLDEEDIDQDNALNFTDAERELERVRRYVVDLSDPKSYARVGKCGVVVRDVNGGIPADASLCWVQVRLPFGSPEDSIAGGPSIRRVRAMRLTVVSGAELDDAAFSLTPIARLRVVGAPWLKRSDHPLGGVGGTTPSLAGSVIASTIGTQDRDSTRGIFYESPPGVSDVPDEASSAFGTQQTQVNERALRLQATHLALGDRAEAFYRFPEGQRSLMGYRELRLWARGRGRGWGQGAPTDLQFFVKLGRDADNFYLYRTPAASGNTRAAWEPEVRVRFERFYALRARLQDAFLHGDTTASGCTGVDSLLVARSGLPPGLRTTRYAACEDGYMVYTADPTVTPPNLAAVQEMAVGIIRVDSLRGSDPPLPGDTAEVWVNEIRLAELVNSVGVAGEVSATLSAGELGSLRLSLRRRDPNFRQIAEAPSFLTNDDLDLSATWRLDRMLPRELGLAIPLTLSHRASEVAPEFVTRSDIRGEAIDGLRTPRVRATSLAINVRRTTADGPWYLAALNNVVLDGSANLIGNRTEFQDASVKDMQLGFDIANTGFFNSPAGAVPGEPSGIPIPWFGGEAARLRIAPSYVRITSAVVRSDDRRSSWLKPATAADDPGTVATGEQRLWRSTSAVEWKLLPSVTARWDVANVYDLRDYDGASLNEVAARRERSGLGLERERTMTSSITVAPATRGWLRPRLALGSTYGMLRDPNNRSLVIETGPADEWIPLLSRRTGNTQYLTAAATIDPGLALGRLAGDSSGLARMARLFRPFDLTVSRNQLASYDGIPVAPGLGFQLGVGGVDGFRSLDGFTAANAGASTDVVLANALALPGGLSLTSRTQRTVSRHWNRRTGERTTRIEGDQEVWPDIAVRWSGQPQPLRGMFSTLGFTARGLRARQTWTNPGDLADSPAEVRRSEQLSFPLSANMVTAWWNVALSGTYAWAQRVDSLPGSVARGNTSDLFADVSKAFPLPASWKLASPLRARMSWQETLAENFVSNAEVVGARSRLTDNGRRAFSLNLDTDLSETMTFSFQGSRIATFDRNLSRRIIQTIFTAVFQMQFFAGASK